MAKEVVGSITSAVTSAVADKAVSKLVDNLGRQTPVSDKLQRLERLCMRVRSTVEVSEKHDIESASLLQWREKLREAVALGDEVLLSFQQQATPTTTDSQAGTSAAGTGSTSTTTALSFTLKALSSMARRIGGAATAALLFSSDGDDDEGTRKLERAVEALEEASENLGEFIGLLHLEASPRLKRRRRAPVIYGSATGRVASVCEFREVPELVGRLQEALAQIGRAVRAAEMGGVEEMELEWLAWWVAFLREARQQGRTVLHAALRCPEHAHEEDELRSFVHTMESVAGDLEFLETLVTSFCHFPKDPYYHTFTFLPGEAAGFIPPSKT